MVWFWILLAVTVLSFAAEYFLSYRKSKWHGLILPVAYFCAACVFLLLNLLHAFPGMEAFGAFLTEYGGAGFFALALKIGFVFSPAAVHLVIYLIFRRAYDKMHNPAMRDKEYKKMLADDLE